MLRESREGLRRRVSDRVKKLKLSSSPIQISWKLNVLQQVTLQCYGHAIQFYGGKCHSLPSPVHDVEVIAVSKKYQIIIIIRKTETEHQVWFSFHSLSHWNTNYPVLIVLKADRFKSANGLIVWTLICQIMTINSREITEIS